MCVSGNVDGVFCQHVLSTCFHAWFYMQKDYAVMLNKCLDIDILTGK